MKKLFTILLISLWAATGWAGPMVTGYSPGQSVETTASPTFVGETLTGLTASKPVFTDSNKAMTSTGTVPVNQGGTGSTVGGLPSQTKTITSTPVTLNAAEIPNAIIFVGTGGSVVNLPPGAASLDGARARIEAKAAVAFSLKPDGTEILSVQGTNLTAAYKVTTDGAAGTGFEVVYDHTSTRWRIFNITGGVYDGGI